MNSIYLALRSKCIDYLKKWVTLLRTSKLRYSKDNLHTYNRAIFFDDDSFMSSYRKGIATDKDRFIKGLDIEWRLHVLCWAAKHSLSLEGDFVECGVRTSIFSTTITRYLEFEKIHKKFLLIDSFSGVIPELISSSEAKREADTPNSDELWNSVYNDVVNQFNDYDNVFVIKGVIPEVLQKLDVEKVAFLSLDLNSAIPEKAALEFFWDKLIVGGIIVLDDYGYPGFEEQQKVHDEFARSKNTQVLCLPTCQGIIIKT